MSSTLPIACKLILSYRSFSVLSNSLIVSVAHVRIERWKQYTDMISVWFGWPVQVHGFAHWVSYIADISETSQQFVMVEWFKLWLSTKYSSSCGRAWTKQFVRQSKLLAWNCRKKIKILLNCESTRVVRTADIIWIACWITHSLCL